MHSFFFTACFLLLACGLESARAANILMVTMGGTKSHKIPFWELAKGLIGRGHRVTFLSGFPADFHVPGLNEVAPPGLVDYIRNYTNWDLLGARHAGRPALTLWQAMQYPAEACNSLLQDNVTLQLFSDAVAATQEEQEQEEESLSLSLSSTGWSSSSWPPPSPSPLASSSSYAPLQAPPTPGQPVSVKLANKFHLAILDGAFPECAAGLVHRLRLPFMYINTVGFYTGSLALAGNPIAYAVTPHVFTAHTPQSMAGLWGRAQNALTHLAADVLHQFCTRQVHAVLRSHFGTDVPHPYTLARHVAFILHNGHATVTYARPLLPNVAEIACIHCRPPVALPSDLAAFVEAAPRGVLFFSMGSSVRAVNMPATLRHLLMSVFARLPDYHVLWKWEGQTQQVTPHDHNCRANECVSGMSATGNDTTPPAEDGEGRRVCPPIGANGENVGPTPSPPPPNVRLSAWLPQQDILGHPRIKAFITHGGLLSMYEAIYHAVPMVMLPVFCDHDVNAAKASADGYAVRLPLEQLTARRLFRGIWEVLHNNSYRRAVRHRQALLRDQPQTPLATAIFWTEFVLRHKGAAHLQSPARDMSFFTYHSLDVLGCFAGIVLLLLACVWLPLRRHIQRTVAGIVMAALALPAALWPRPSGRTIRIASDPVASAAPATAAGGKLHRRLTLAREVRNSRRRHLQLVAS